MSNEPNSLNLDILSSNKCLLSVYFFINAVMVWKYSGKIDINGLWATPAYLILGMSLVALLSSRRISTLMKSRPRFSYYLIVMGFAIVLLSLMSRFDPAAIDVGRYPALNGWIERLFDGRFPYSSDTNPSGFPFLFVLSIPFYMVGDLGYFQIVGFILLAIILDIKSSQHRLDPIVLILLLVLSPAFLFEIVTRSELFSNMVLVICFLATVEKYFNNASIRTTIVMGLIGGLLLSTRAIVFFVYVMFFGPIFLKQQRKMIIFTSAAVVSFAATITPFLIWNHDYFINYGPLAIQSSYSPVWWIVTTVLVSIVIAWRVKAPENTYKAVSLVLFGIVLIPFVLSVAKFGLSGAVLNHRFDISYFCFCLPFLLISIRKPNASHQLT